MTTEEKAKAYDEASKWMEGIYPTLTHEQQGEAEAFFPMFKESEDERIRGKIIATIHLYYGEPLEDEAKEMIAWLEKQRKVIKDKKLSDLLNKVICRFINDPNIPYSERDEVSKKIIPYVKQLEKQGEQKPAFEMKTPEESLGIDSDTYNKIVDECIYGEQKPADKVESKFKVGNWIIKDNYSAQQVKEADKDSYTLDGSISGIETLPKKYIEKNYHLWTIQDAKDGDVLVNQDGEMPFIFKECKDNHVYCFCGYTNRKDVFFDKFVDSEGEELHWLNLYHEQAYPATKEQRDQLYKAMHEAGYELDAEKLQLNKIEQKPTDADLKDVVDKEANAIWKEINTGGSHSVIDSFNQFYGICIQVAEAVVDCKKPTEWIQELESKLSNATPEQLAEWKEKYFKVEPAWSEEDEIYISDVMWCIEQARKVAKNENDMGTTWCAERWIKSIKDKFVPQPKQEWKPSEEQINALDFAVDCVVPDEFCYKRTALKSLLTDLRNLTE